MTSAHDPLLVLLSVAIAAFTSFTALDLAGRAQAAGGSRIGWLLTAATAMGGGVWAMHFVAMLAFSIAGMSMRYSPDLTIVSLLVPIAAAAAAFLVIGRFGARLRFLLPAGLLLGAGIAAMHYLGMSAIQMPVELVYTPGLFALSVAFTLASSTVALWIAFQANGLLQKAIAAVAMGMAISGVHYAAMASATFVPADADARAVPGIDQTGIALLVAGATFVVLFLALVAAVYDRRTAISAEHQSQALRQSEARFRRLYRNSPLPLATLDANLVVDQVSDAWLELLGYGREEVVGHPLSDFMVSASAQRWTAQDALLLRQGEDIRQAEHQFRQKRGDTVEVLFSARLESAEDSSARILVGLVDITERRKAEQALRQAQKMEAVGQLTGGIAHDFNNLLTVVIGNLESADRAVRTGLFVKAQRNIEAALNGANRAVGATQRLLAFSRPQPLRPTMVDLNACVRSMSELFQRTLGGSMLIDTELGDDVRPVRVDANQLENALLNLVINSRDAMSEGGTVRIKTENRKGGANSTVAAAQTGPSGDYVTVSVSDSGKGIPPEALPKVFEPFFTTKQMGKGTGLGLSMVLSFVKQSGGEIVIDSEPEKGTTVTIHLPAVSAGEGAGEEPPAIRSTSSSLASSSALLS